ncbi:hypothetical protein L9F63_021156, partial [Diploptera punctata]
MEELVTSEIYHRVSLACESIESNLPWPTGLMLLKIAGGGSSPSMVVSLLTIRQEKNGGAWCPKAQISSDVREYLEVDLTRPHLITRTETQGRFGNGQGQEYAEQFLVEYWRDSLQQWTVYKDSNGQKVLAGNTNTYLVVSQDLELPFVASKVRFIPYSQHTRTVCMRVELYGCPWE